MQSRTRRHAFALTLAAMAASSFLAGCGGGSDPVAAPAPTPDAEDQALQFDAGNYKTVNVTVDGVATKIRQYKVVYVAKPIKMAAVQYNEQTGQTTTLDDPYTYQTMIVSVPEALASDQKAPLWVRLNNGGWFASTATGASAKLKIIEGANLVTTGVDYDAAAAAAALKAGYVVVDVGNRSRGIRSEDGRWVGKSPAAVVDVKAAIRYLRLNDGTVPGSSERIILTGHSGGGALTSAVAASGESTDYLPYLADIGAAGVSGSGSSTSSTLKDGVFAAVAYSPINNLGNADAGYEWQYSAIRDDSNTPALNGVPYSAGKQPAASAAIAATFGPYLNGLKLKRADGTLLTDSVLPDVIKSEIKSEIERQIAKGTAVPQLGENFNVVKISGTPPAATSQPVVNDWLTLNGSGTSATVANIDYTKFLRFQAINYTVANRMLKSVVAFDAVGVTDNKPWTISGESNLFGNEFFSYSNFTEWSWNNNAVKGDGSGADDTGQNWKDYIASSSNNLAQQLKLINAVDYLTTSSSTPAPYWYVRHGMLDRDTAIAMQVLLAHALKNNAGVKEASFQLSYGIGHTGFSDVGESFAWIKEKLAANP